MVLSATLPLDVRQAAVARRSARVEPWQVVVLREISTEDLLSIHASAPERRDPKAPLSQIRDGHHMLAQMIARGEDPVNVSAITGYSVARIRTLERDPAFGELVSHYETQEVFASANISAQIQHVSLTAKQVLLDRLENDPEGFSNKELKEIFQMGLDRLGHGPTTKHQHMITDPRSIIEALKSELIAEANGQIISRQEIEAHYQEVSVEELKDVEAETGSGLVESGAS